MEGCDAVICATGGGATSPFDDRAKTVDNLGTQHLVDAAHQAGVKRFVFVSSLLTNAKANGQATNPNYVILQLFGGVLEEKLKARGTTAPCCVWTRCPDVCHLL
jgi:NAD(P)H-binding